MTKRDLERLKHQIEEDRQRLLESLPEDKRLELERIVELDIPKFLRAKQERFERYIKARRVH